MIEDILLVDIFRARELDNALHVAYYGRVSDRVTLFVQQTEEDALPAQLAAQLTRFKSAYAKEDDLYRITLASRITKNLATADELEDKLYRQARNVINLYASSDFDADKQAAAQALQFSLKKYDIDPSEAYERESTKILQWFDEATIATSELPKHIQTLGLTALIRDLRKAAMQVRELIGQRNDELAPIQNGALKAARAESDVQYRLLILVLNSCAVLDSTEKRYEELIQQMNRDITYYRSTILAHDSKGKSKDDPDSGDDKQDDDSDKKDDSSDSGDDGKQDGGDEGKE